MRPTILGIVGDSGSGKTTITRGLVRVLGEDKVSHFGTDDYHRYDRQQRAERGITPLDPACNYIDILTQHLAHIRRYEPVLKPVYRHRDGTFGPPVYFKPGPFVVVEGLLAFHTAELRDMYDVRVYLDPPEELRRRWKVDRDCTRRGYTTDQVLAELDRREPDSEAFIRPQRHWADIIVRFEPGESDEQDKLDARLVLRDTLLHPDLSGVIGANGGDGLTLVERAGAQELRVPGTIDPRRAAAIEEVIWERMHFASHLRQQRLGEFTVGTDLRRSESLALVQLIILYHLVTARASIATGGDGGRMSARRTRAVAVAAAVAAEPTATAAPAAATPAAATPAAADEGGAASGNRAGAGKGGAAGSEPEADGPAAPEAPAAPVADAGAPLAEPAASAARTAGSVAKTAPSVANPGPSVAARTTPVAGSRRG